MSEADRRKWDERFASGYYAERTQPSVLLQDWLPDLPRGRALDVACGAGRNACYLAKQGYEVDAVDISAVGLEQGAGRAAAEGLEIHWYAADLDTQPPGSTLPGHEEYALIVVVRYVDLPLLRHLASRLCAGGYLLTEQHLATPRDVIGPRSSDYRVAPNALLAAASGLRVVAYREGLVDDPDGRRAALAQLVACRAPALFDTPVEERTR